MVMCIKSTFFALLPLTIMLSQLSLLEAEVNNHPLVFVKKVDFNPPTLLYPDEWIEVEIELLGKSNPMRNARNSRYIDDITVNLSLGYKAKTDAKKENTQSYHFFESKAEILTLEQDNSVFVHFFIPPDIKKRDSLPKEPEFYMIELEVNSEALQLQKENVSRNLQSKKSSQKYKARSASQSGSNQGILLPIYRTIFWNRVTNSRSFNNIPTYRIPSSN
jgi:hypothetical protein